MITQEKMSNKAMSSGQINNKDTKKESYHFSGSGRYVPISVDAENQDEAVRIWEKKRELIK